MHNTEVINMCIEAVWVGHKSSRKMVTRYAMLDNCSERSFNKEEIIEELEITGRKLNLSLETLMGEKLEELAAVNVLIVSGISCSKEVPVEWIEVPKAYSRSFLPVERDEIATPKKIKKNKTLWPLFMDGVQLPQGYSHFEEVVYFLPFSSQKFLVLILSTSEG